VRRQRRQLLQHLRQRDVQWLGALWARLWTVVVGLHWEPRWAAGGA
jgi:hypothetical protein